MPGFHAGWPPHTGVRYAVDPPKVEEIIAVMHKAGEDVHGVRRRGLIAIVRRAGLRIHEKLALAGADLDARRGSLLVRHGKGGRRREVGVTPHDGLLLCATNDNGLVRADIDLAAAELRCAGSGRPTRHAGRNSTSCRWR